MKLTAPMTGVFGSIATYDGHDPGHLRLDQAATSAVARVFVEEESCRSVPNHIPNKIQDQIQDQILASYNASPPPPLINCGHVPCV